MNDERKSTFSNRHLISISVVPLYRIEYCIRGKVIDQNRLSFKVFVETPVPKVTYECILQNVWNSSRILSTYFPSALL